MKILFKFFIFIISTLSISGILISQNPVLYEHQFYERSIDGRSVFLEMDTLMKLPMSHEMYNISSHQEVLWSSDGQDATFLAEYWFGNNKGNRLLCKCEKDQMISFLQKQRQASQQLKQGAFSFGMGDMKFQNEHCLNESIAVSPKYNRAIINDFLNSKQANTPKIEIVNATLKTDFINKKDRSLVYFEGNLDSDYKIISLGKNHRLREIKQENGTDIYPPSSLPEWKKDLIRKGHFNSNIVGSSDNWSNVCSFSDYEYKKLDSDIGVTLNIDPTYTNIRSGITIKGAVEVLVESGKDSLFEMQMPMCTDCILTITKYDGSINVSRKDGSDAGQFNLDKKSPWHSIEFFSLNISNGKRKQVINVDKMDADFIKEIVLEDKEVLYFRTKVPLPKSVYIPIDIALLAPKEGTKPKLNELILHQYALKNNGVHLKDNGLTIKYRVALPKDSQISTIEMDKVIDSNQRDLHARQESYIDATNDIILKKHGANRKDLLLEDQYKKGYSFKRNKYYSDENMEVYEITFQYYDIAYPIESIQLSGNVHVEKSNAMLTDDIVKIPLDKIISLSFNENIKNSRSLNDALKPTLVSWSSIVNSFSRQGITAAFNIPQEKGNIFVDIDHSQSLIRHLKDTEENDLILSQKTHYNDRISFLKMSDMSYSFDNYSDINKEISINSYNTRHTNGPLSFELNAYTTPQTNIVNGMVTIKLLGYKSSIQPKSIVTTINNNSQSINLQIGDEVSVYKDGEWGERDQDKNKYTKYQNLVYSNDYFIKSIKAYDGQGNLVSIPDGKDYNNINQDSRFILIKEGTKGPIKLEIIYFDLQAFDRTYPIEISFDLE